VRDDALRTVQEFVDEHGYGLVALRRQLHAHPELSGREHATTQLLLDRLRGAGLHPVVLPSGTGLTCDIGTDGPMVALRGDIDALGMHDAKQVSYRSQVEGVAHACGHDVHTTVVLGAGLALAHALAGATGRVRLIFEPSEEAVPAGALEVIEAGGLAGVSAIFGLHCDPKLEVGRLGTRVGPITSAADLVEITVTGPGGHTARPHLGVDVVGALGRLVTALPVELDDRSSKRLHVVFGAVHAGDASNVLPARGVLRGTLRTPDRDVWLDSVAMLEGAVADVLGPTGAGWSVEHRRGDPPVVNDPAANALLEASGAEVLGAANVVPTEHSMGGDSFAWYTEQIPGAYARLGVHDPLSTSPRLDLHAATFDVDERAIALGVRILAGTALAALGESW
jgi:amidohydrolase